MKFDFSINFEPSKREKEVFSKVKKKVKTTAEKVTFYAKEKAEEVADIFDDVKAKSLKNEYLVMDSIENMEAEELFEYILEAIQKSSAADFSILDEDNETFTCLMKLKKLTEENSSQEEKCHNCPCNEEDCTDCNGPKCVAGKV